MEFGFKQMRLLVALLGHRDRVTPAVPLTAGDRPATRET